MIFLIDLILGFFTSFINHKGKESFDSDEIAAHHTDQPIFYTDLLSIFGNSLFQKINHLFKTLIIFKLFRIFKLNKMITTSNMTVTQKTYFLIAKILIYIGVYIHLVACMWWITISYNNNIQFTKYE